MSLSTLGTLLGSVPQFGRLRRALSQPPHHVRVQVIGEAVPFVLAALARPSPAKAEALFGNGGPTGPMLVVTPRPEEARRLYEQLLIWSDSGKAPESNVLHFPESEALPFERLASDAETAQQRLRTLAALVANKDRPAVVVASASAISQKTLVRAAYESSTHTLSRGQQVELDDLLAQWRRMGYRFEPVVDVPGVVARRGGILDIFPIGAEHPVRIELWGPEVDSVRTFDPLTQRSIAMVDAVEVMPAQETLPALAERGAVDRLLATIDLSNCSQAVRERLTEESHRLLDGYDIEDVNFYAGLFNTGSLLDYLPDEAVVVRAGPDEIGRAAWEADEHAHELRTVKEQRGELPRGFPSSHLLWRDVEPQFDRFVGKLDVLAWGATDLTPHEVLELPFSAPPRYLGNLGRFCEDVEAMSRGGQRVVAVTSLPKRLGEVLAERGVRAVMPDGLETAPEPGVVTVLPSTGAGLAEGFTLTADSGRLVVFSDAEVFGVAKRRRVAKRHMAARESPLGELQPGDYVVHVEHGVARFLGTGRASADEGGGEYLILEYAAGDKLYVPMEQLDRISPYIAPMDRAPALSRLGTQEWRKTKERVAKATREMAAELLSLYAARQAIQRPTYGPDVPWQVQLEDSFPYEETTDQVRTMGEVKADMGGEKPMDRLVCGDVGFGKTEIALRAAFKAVLDGKQVAVLVPTTVLAQQHYVTFSQRLNAFPVRVDVLSRFRSDHEQNEIVTKLALGEIDICIGTHRLIQKDVRFKDLGLVIIDEEHRFGVSHKERLKQMRREVDVLTLTATPIPRTLHMSLAGIRDMSTIETPPEDRLPIKTYVSEFSDALIREAVLRELDRQGQVYFLHNRVHSIGYMADYIRRIVPEAEVGVAHGQMPEGQLEQAMLAFAEGKMEVLVCTTIIESGLDIPNVNTLIVDRADTFGLAQLYQLRGRVGRSARRAYTYLLVPQSRSITETAEKRLKTMLAATELGAGFRIAMKDLEIRGAGNILGAQQSGHIYAVGFELYTRLLSQAAEELRARQAAGLPLDGVGEGDTAEAEGIVQQVGEAAAEELEAVLTRIEAKGAQPPAIDLGIPTSIPEEYVADLPMRVGLYQRLVKLEKAQDIEAMETELRDRFGPPPWPVKNLLYAVRLRILAQQADVERVTKEDGRIALRLRHDVGGARNVLQRLFGKRVEVGNTQLRMPLADGGEGWEKALADVLGQLAEFRERFAAEASIGIRA